jgi:hypothetical protein
MERLPAKYNYVMEVDGGLRPDRVDLYIIINYFYIFRYVYQTINTA